MTNRASKHTPLRAHVCDAREQLQGRAHTADVARKFTLVRWLSQFSHEKETLFPPLMAVEVVKTRIQRHVLVIEAKFNLNMLSLTLDQVVSRRRKVVFDMKEQMQQDLYLRKELWAMLRQLEGGEQGAKRFIATLDEVAQRDPVYYNKDEQLGTAVNDAVALSDILARWPAGLQALARRCGATGVAELVRGADGHFGHTEGSLSLDEVHGLIALMWIKELATLDLSKQRLLPKAVRTLCRVLPPSLASLTLNYCDIANDGKGQIGVEALTQMLQHKACQLKALGLAGNKLGADHAASIAVGLGACKSLVYIDLSQNCLASEGVKALVAGGAFKGSLAGIDIGHNEIDQADALELLAAMKGKDMQRIGMAGCELGVKGAKIVAEMMPAMPSLSALLLSSNKIGAEGIEALGQALPRSTSLIEMDLSCNDLTDYGSNMSGVEALADGISACSSLTNLKCGLP